MDCLPHQTPCKRPCSPSFCEPDNRRIRFCLSLTTDDEKKREKRKLIEIDRDGFVNGSTRTEIRRQLVKMRAIFKIRARLCQRTFLLIERRNRRWPVSRMDSGVRRASVLLRQHCKEFNFSVQDGLQTARTATVRCSVLIFTISFASCQSFTGDRRRIVKMCEHNRKTSDRGRQHEKVKTVNMVISNLFSRPRKTKHYRQTA